MSETLLPKPRPNKGLNKLSEFPNEPPVPIPGDGGDAATLEWCEKLRDWYEERGFYVSPKGLLKFTELAGLEDDDAKEAKSQIKKLYAAEFAQIEKKKDSGTSPKSNKKSKTEPKEKSVATVTKEKPKKKVHPAKSKKDRIDKAIASKNGKHVDKKTKPSKKESPRVVRDESETVYSASIRGVPVAVQQTATGRFSVTFGGFAMRKMAQFLGKKGWLVGEVKQVYNRLLAKWKGGEEYVKNVLEEGHVGAGSKANKAGKCCFGNLPDVDKETYRAMNSLKK